MKVVAVFGKEVSEAFFPSLEKLLRGLTKRGIKLICEERFYTFLSELPERQDYFRDLFNVENISEKEVDLFLSIGGDGTFLHSMQYVKDSGIPILGMNTGRLGFLSSFTTEEIDTTVDIISQGDYAVEERGVLKIRVGGEEHHVLNEISVQKTDISSLILIHAYVGDEYLTTYWADGLIVASPTGSTAYSMSAGGPILTPDCRNMVLTPLCPHNLGMRSLVIPWDAMVRLKVESRSGSFLLTMDSAVKRVKDTFEIEIGRGEFKICVVKFPGSNFFRTLRDKLGWGEDKRNKM